MNSMIIAAIILIVVVYMFFSPRFSNGIVAISGALAFGLVGYVNFKDIFTSFASNSIVLMISMMVIGGGLFHTGFAGWLGKQMVRLTGTSERSIQFVAIFAGAVLSSVASGSASMMILFPIISSICLASNVSMSKVILPMAIGIGAGSFMTLAGSGMTVFTSNFLIDAGLDGLAYFESTKIALPSLIIQVLAFILIGYKVLPNTHVKPDAAVALKADSLPSSFNGKMGISAAILIFTITGMVINSPKLPMQVCAAIGAMASVFTGCLTEKDMYKSINWGTVAIIGGMSIVGKGVQASGLGDFIANGTINALGNNPSPFSIVAVMLLSTGLITQFMSNNAACALMAPIALSLSNTLGYDSRAFLIAVMFGSGIGTLTVMATPVMAFMMDIGHYTPKDFFKWGAVLLIPNSIIIMILVSVFYL